MKKITIISIASFIFLTISSIVAYFLRYSLFDNPLSCLLMGVSILIYSGILALILRKVKSKYYLILIIPFIISAIALGFMIRAWYIFREFDNSLWVMLLVSLACLLYLWIYYFLLYIPFINKHYKLFLLLYIIVSLVCYVFLIAFTTTTFVSTFGYYMIVEIAFMFALCSKVSTYKELIKNLVISSYSVFIVAIIIFLAILAGDGLDLDVGLDGLDISIDSDGKKKKQGFNRDINIY